MLSEEETEMEDPEEDDPEGFMERLEETVRLADKHGLRILMTFFTNGGTIKNPYLGPQPQPVPFSYESVAPLLVYTVMDVKSLLPAMPEMICPSSSLAGFEVIMVPGSCGRLVFRILIGMLATLAG